MGTRLPLIIIILFASGTLSLLLTAFSLWKASRRVAVSFALLTLFTALWAFGYATEMATPILSIKVLMKKVEYLGIASVPALWFLFTCQYTGYRTKFTRKFLLAVALEPILTLLLVWTNGWHHLIYKSMNVVQKGGFAVLTATYGDWFWVHVYYSAFLAGATVIIAIEQYVRSREIEVEDALILLAASTLPWIGNLVAFTTPEAFYLNLTPVFLLVSYTIAAIGIWRHRTFDPVEAGRNRVAEKISEAYIVMDDKHRILDLNQAAARYLKKPRHELIGEQLLGAASVAPPYDRIAALPLPFSETVEQDSRFIEVQGEELKDGEGKRAGILVMWRDVTEIVNEKLLEEKIEQLSYINFIVETINKAFTLKEIYETAIQIIIKILKADKASVLLFDEEGIVRFVAWSGLSEEYRNAVEGHSPWPPDAVDPLPVLVEDVEQTDDPALVRVKGVMLKEGIRALGFIPIVHQGKLLGKFMVYYSEPHKFEESEIELAKTIAGHLAIAIGKAKLLEQSQKRMSRIEALREIDLTISSTLDLDQQVDILLSHVIRELNVDIAVLFLLDKNTRRIAPVAAKGSYNPETLRKVSFEIGEGAVGWIVLNKKPLYIPDVSKDKRWKFTESSTADRIVSYLGIPLVVDGEPIGALDASTRYPRKFTEEEISFLEALSVQIAIAIKNAKLYRELQERVRQMEALYEISGEIMAEHDLDSLLRRITDRATDLLRAPSGGIYLYDEKKKLLRVAVVKGTELPSNTYLKLGEGMAGRVALTRRPLIVDDYSRWEHRSPKYADRPFTAVVEVPMLHSGELIGVLVVNEIGFTGRKFTEEDAKLLSLLASHAADAVHNARLISELKEKVERQQALYQISAELARSRNRRVISQTVAKLLHEKLRYKYVSVLLLDQKSGDKVVMGRAGDVALGALERVPEGKGVSEKALQTGKLQYWPDVTKEPDYYPGGKDSRSEVDVPIRSGERLYGVLTVESDEIDAFDQEDFNMLQAVADQMAVALDNVQKVNEISSMLKSTKKLYQASSSIASVTTVQEIMESALRFLWSASGGRTTVIRTFSVPHESSLGVDSQGNLMPDMCKDQIPRSMLQRVELTRRPIVVEGEQIPETLRLRGVVQALILPMVGEKGVIGALGILYDEETTVPAQEIEIYSIYANHTATAIEKAISIEEARRRALEQEVVSSVARALNETLDVEEVFPKLVEGIRKLVPADRISIALPDEEKTHFKISVLFDSTNEIPPGRWYPVEATAAAQDILQGKVHITPDLSQETDFPGERALYEAGHRSRVNVPLIAGSDIVGTLNVVSRKPNAFSAESLPPLLQIADVLSISIVNARTFKQEKERAQDLSTLYSLSRTLSTLETAKTVAKTVVDTIERSVKDRLDARMVLVGRRFRFESPAGTKDEGTFVWVEDFHSYPNISKGLEDGSALWDVSSEAEGLLRQERALLFAKGGKYAHVFALRRGGELLGCIVVESNRETCSDTATQLVGSIAELTSMALRRILLFHEVEEAYLNAVIALAKTIDAKDSYTANHSQQLETMAIAIAVEMGLDRQTIEDLKFGAQLHDIGKIGIPDSILKKPGPLTPEEWKIMRKHPEIGEKILSPLPKLRGAAAIVRHHHERFDGSGYPDGLKGEEIPIGARILAVVDAYSAIIDRRVYKEPRPHSEAIEELKKNAGTQFDPQVVEIFLRLFGGANPALPQVVGAQEVQTSNAGGASGEIQ